MYYLLLYVIWKVLNSTFKRDIVCLCAVKIDGNINKWIYYLFFASDSSGRVTPSQQWAGRASSLFGSRNLFVVDLLLLLFVVNFVYCLSQCLEMGTKCFVFKSTYDKRVFKGRRQDLLKIDFVPLPLKMHIMT